MADEQDAPISKHDESETSLEKPKSKKKTDLVFAEKNDGTMLAGVPREASVTELERLRLKKLLATEAVQAQVSDKDIDALLESQRILDQRQYEQFLLNFIEQFKNDPATVQMYLKQFPELAETRMAYLKKIAENQLKKARIEMMGITTKDDLAFLYGLYTGNIKVPDKPVHKIVEDGIDKRLDEPLRGLLNPKKYGYISHGPLAKSAETSIWLNRGKGASKPVMDDGGMRTFFIKRSQ